MGFRCYHNIDHFGDLSWKISCHWWRLDQDGNCSRSWCHQSPRNIRPRVFCTVRIRSPHGMCRIRLNTTNRSSIWTQFSVCAGPCSSAGEPAPDPARSSHQAARIRVCIPSTLTARKVLCSICWFVAATRSSRQPARLSKSSHFPLHCDLLNLKKRRIPRMIVPSRRKLNLWNAEIRYKGNIEVWDDGNFAQDMPFWFRVDSDRMRCVFSLRIIASKITHAWNRMERVREIACVFTQTIWTVLLNNVCYIYFFRRMRKSHAIIRSKKIATHPIWIYPQSNGNKKVTLKFATPLCNILGLLEQSDFECINVI